MVHVVPAGLRGWAPLVMSWRVLLVAVAIVLATVWSAELGEDRIVDVQDRAVEIATLPCHTSQQSTSSGIVMDDELVLTVAHALFESRDFAVRDASGRWHAAYAEYLDLERDLALVRVEGLEASPIDRAAAADEGDGVVLLEGASSGTVPGTVMRPVRIRTEVVGDRDRVNRRRGYEVALEIQAGDSGAALVNEAGELVGVVFARSTRRASVTWATAISEVDEIVGRSGVPDWDCGPGDGTRLVLPDEKPGETRELASVVGAVS